MFWQGLIWCDRGNKSWGKRFMNARLVLLILGVARGNLGISP